MKYTSMEGFYRIVAEDVRGLVRDVPDFPKPGILFRDITPVLRDPHALAAINFCLSEKAKRYGEIDMVASPEARGFIFATPVALSVGAGFVPIRKPGKLPYRTISGLVPNEYKPDERHEIHVDAIERGQRVLYIDDLLATGGTAQGDIELLREAGAEIVAAIFPFEIKALNGRQRLNDYPVQSLVVFE